MTGADADAKTFKNDNSCQRRLSVLVSSTPTSSDLPYSKKGAAWPHPSWRRWVVYWMGAPVVGGTVPVPDVNVFEVLL